MLGSTFGLCLGTGLGLGYDNLAGGMGLGLSIGIGVGITLGAILEDRQAKATTPSSDLDRRAR